MTAPLEQIAAAMVEAIPAVLDGAEAGTPILLPRGADPFAGAERPILIAATRWTAVSPGGVILGGTAEALSTVLGFELPARPEVPAEAEHQNRRATDPQEGEEGDEPTAEPEAESTPEPAPAADADAGDDDEGDAPAPARRWSDHVADAAKTPATTTADGLIKSLAALAGLPHGAAATQAVLAESDAMVASAVGPLPDAVVVPIRRGESEVRLVVVVAGIVSARIAAAALEVGSTSGPGAAPVDTGEPEGPVGPVGGAPALALASSALGEVPLDLSAEIGTTRMPLSSVLSLREGAVVDLAESVEAPVALVAGTTAVATGELELDDAGTLVLHVTGIPGRPDLTAGPSLMADEPSAAAGPAAPGADQGPTADAAPTTDAASAPDADAATGDADAPPGADE